MYNKEELSMQIIAHSGTAKSKYIESLNYANESQFDKAVELIESGKHDLQKACEVHLEALKQSVLDDSRYLDLLLAHAEDQMMSAEVFERMVLEMIRLYRKIEGEKD